MPSVATKVAAARIERAAERRASHAAPNAAALEAPLPLEAAAKAAPFNVWDLAPTCEDERPLIKEVQSMPEAILGAARGVRFANGGRWNENEQGRPWTNVKSEASGKYWDIKWWYRKLACAEVILRQMAAASADEVTIAAAQSQFAAPGGRQSLSKLLSSLKAADTRKAAAAAARLAAAERSPEGVIEVGGKSVPVACLAMTTSDEERREQAELKLRFPHFEFEELPAVLQWGLVVSRDCSGGSGQRGYFWVEEYYVLEQEGAQPQYAPPSERLWRCKVAGVERTCDQQEVDVTKATLEEAMGKTVSPAILTLAGKRLVAEGVLLEGSGAVGNAAHPATAPAPAPAPAASATPAAPPAPAPSALVRGTWYKIAGLQQATDWNGRLAMVVGNTQTVQPDEKGLVDIYTKEGGNRQMLAKCLVPLPSTRSRVFEESNADVIHALRLGSGVDFCPDDEVVWKSKASLGQAWDALARVAFMIRHGVETGGEMASIAECEARYLKDMSETPPWTDVLVLVEAYTPVVRSALAEGKAAAAAAAAVAPALKAALASAEAAEKEVEDARKKFPDADARGDDTYGRAKAELTAKRNELRSALISEKGRADMKGFLRGLHPIERSAFPPHLDESCQLLAVKYEGGTGSGGGMCWETHAAVYHGAPEQGNVTCLHFSGSESKGSPVRPWSVVGPMAPAAVPRTVRMQDGRSVEWNLTDAGRCMLQPSRSMS